jgi:hypothetical protein
VYGTGATGTRRKEKDSGFILRCRRCGVYLTIGGDTKGPVGTRTEVEAHAWIMDETVKCWNCGWEYRPTRKPGDLPRLKMGKETPAERHHRSGLHDFYRDIGQKYEILRQKIHGRKIA